MDDIVNQFRKACEIFVYRDAQYIHSRKKKHYDHLLINALVKLWYINRQKAFKVNENIPWGKILDQHYKLNAEIILTGRNNLRINAKIIYLFLFETQET